MFNENAVCSNSNRKCLFRSWIISFVQKQQSYSLDAISTIMNCISKYDQVERTTFSIFHSICIIQILSLPMTTYIRYTATARDFQPLDRRTQNPWYATKFVEDGGSKFTVTDEESLLREYIGQHRYFQLIYHCSFKLFLFCWIYYEVISRRTYTYVHLS